MSGNYPSPRFPSIKLQKQGLGKPSPRCNLGWVELQRPGIQETPECILRCIFSLGFVTVCGLFPLPPPSPWSGRYVTSHRRTVGVTVYPGHPSQNRHCSFSVCPGISSSAHLGSSLCVCVCLSLLQKIFPLAFTVRLKTETAAGCRALLHPILLHGGLGARSTTVFLQQKVCESKQ